MNYHRAVAYIRVSTDEQATEGHSLDNQYARIKAYADSQGWELIETFREEGISGKTLDRPELSRLIEAVQDCRMDVVLVYKVDRLTRRQKHLWTLLEDVLEPNRVGFKSVTESFDTTTAQGKAFLSMIGTFAQLERDTTSERTRDALANKKVNGEWVGRVPFGYHKASNGKLEKDPDAQKTIMRMKRLRRRGKSYREIAQIVGINYRTVHRALNKNGRNSRPLN